MDIRIKHRTLVLSAAIMALVFATGPAQYNLGVGYAKGQGVCKDYVQAHKGVNLAASRTTPEEMGGSRSLVRDSLAEKMTASHGPQPFDGGVHVDGVPGDDGIRDQV